MNIFFLFLILDTCDIILCLEIVKKDVIDSVDLNIKILNKDIYLKESFLFSYLSVSKKYIENV